MIMTSPFEDECQLAYSELMLSGAVIIGKRRQDGLWNAKTYRILKRIREMAEFDGQAVVFDKTDGSVSWQK